MFQSFCSLKKKWCVYIVSIPHMPRRDFVCPCALGCLRLCVCVHVLKIKTKVSEVLKDLGVNQLPGYQSLCFF